MSICKYLKGLKPAHRQGGNFRSWKTENPVLGRAKENNFGGSQLDILARGAVALWSVGKSNRGANFCRRRHRLLKIHFPECRIFAYFYCLLIFFFERS